MILKSRDHDYHKLAQALSYIPAENSPQASSCVQKLGLILPHSKQYMMHNIILLTLWHPCTPLTATTDKPHTPTFRLLSYLAHSHTPKLSHTLPCILIHAAQHAAPET